MKKYNEIIKASKKDGSPVVFLNNKIFFPDKYSNLYPAPDEEWEIQVKFERDKWGVFVPLKRIENVEFDWNRKLYILKSGWREIKELPTRREEWVILEEDVSGLPRIRMVDVFIYNELRHYENDEFVYYDIDDNYNILIDNIEKLANKKFVNELNNEENLFIALNRYIRENKRKIDEYIRYRKEKKERERKLKEIKEKITTEWTIEKSIQLYKTLNQLTVEELERDSDYFRYKIVADGEEYYITEGEDMGLEENLVNSKNVIKDYSICYLALNRRDVLREMYSGFDEIIKEIGEEIKKGEGEIEIKSDEVREYSFTPSHDRVNENKDIEKDKERVKEETEKEFEKMNIKLEEDKIIEKEYEFGKIIIEKYIKRRIDRKWDRFLRGKEKLVKIPSLLNMYPDDYAVEIPFGTVYSQYIIKVIPEVETKYNVEFDNNVPQLVRNDILHYIEKEVSKK